MSINKNFAIALVVGIVVGGLIIGLLDANRPKPLFSSAFSPDGNGNQTCAEAFDQSIAVLKSAPNGAVTNATAIAALQGQKKNCAIDLPAVSAPAEN